MGQPVALRVIEPVLKALARVHRETVGVVDLSGLQR
jgi:hypothetical protein